MQGTIAQIVALVLEGNAALRGIESRGLDRAHSTMTFCEFVRFVDLQETPAGWAETPAADDPVAWIDLLRQQDVSALRMTYGPSGNAGADGSGVNDRMLVGFVGGGGRWLVEARRPGGCDYWESRWEVGDRQRTDRRIWQVTYGRIASDCAPGEIEPDDLPALIAQFRALLEQIKAFADRHALGGFASCFARGLEDLAADAPRHAFHKDLLNPALLPADALRLLSAAQSAWVFGGMGSWNDQGFDGEDQAVYERLSDALYQLINRAIVAAANSSAAATASSSR